MKIIKQTSEQKCGVCVLTMLANKFYSNKISKANVLAKTNLSDKGLNLLDLEKTGAEFGLNIESYECEWDEIFKLDKYEPFIILINNEGANHYAVGVLKRKQQLHIYDPIGKKVIAFKDDNNFKFLNIICLVTKTKTILPTIDFAKPLWSQFYSHHIFWFFFVGVFMFATNLLISFGMSKLFNLIPQNNEVLTILIISLILIIMIFINYLAKQFEWLIKT